MNKLNVDPNMDSSGVNAPAEGISGTGKNGPDDAMELIVDDDGNNESCSAVIGLTNSEREAVLNNPVKSREAQLEQKRMIFHRLSVMSMNNGMAVDDDREEHAEFFSPELDVRGGKRQLMDYLDRLELDSARRDSDMEWQKQKKSERPSIWNNLKEAMKSAATSVPRLIDALLPPSLQTVPKLEMIRGLQNEKTRLEEKANREYDQDLNVLERKHDVIKDYVAQFYGDVIVPFNVQDSAQLQKFIDDCLINESSLHYAQIEKITQSRIEARKRRLMEELERIARSEGAEETIKEIRESSWALRSIDKAKAMIARVRSNWDDWVDTKIAQPTMEMVYAYGKEAEKATYDNRSNDVHLSANGRERTTVAQGGGHEMRGGRDGGGRSRNWAWGPLGAAAVVLSASLFANDASRVTQTISAASPSPTPSSTDTAKAPDQKQELKPLFHNSEEVSKDDQKPVEQKTQIPKPVTEGKKSAKSVDVPKRTEINASVKADKEAGAVEAVTGLTEEVKMAEMRLVEAKIAGYKHRMELIEKDKGRYLEVASLASTIKGNLVQVSALLGKVKGEMSTLNERSQLTTIGNHLSQIDKLLQQTDKTIIAINAADTALNAINAQKLLEGTERLSRQFGGRFQVQHLDRDKGQVVVYDVNVSDIRTRLAKISDGIDNNRISLQEGRMMGKDAQYWVGYLKFINWNLQHNSGQISASRN